MLVPEDAKKNRTDLEAEKTQICQNIVKLFKRKVEVIQKLQKAVPDCRDREREIYQNLSNRMKSQPNINTEEWEKLYKTVTDFNKDIRTRYTKMNSMIRSILNAATEKELDSLHKESIDLISDTNAVCDLAINRELREFRSAEVSSAPKSPRAVSSPSPGSAPRQILRPPSRGEAPNLPRWAPDLL
jgi:Skp family chaperone for outer membrane proteins